MIWSWRGVNFWYFLTVKTLGLDLRCTFRDAVLVHLGMLHVVLGYLLLGSIFYLFQVVELAQLRNRRCFDCFLFLLACRFPHLSSDCVVFAHHIVFRLQVYVYFVLLLPHVKRVVSISFELVGPVQVHLLQGHNTSVLHSTHITFLRISQEHILFSFKLHFLLFFELCIHGLLASILP